MAAVVVEPILKTGENTVRFYLIHPKMGVGGVPKTLVIIFISVISCFRGNTFHPVKHITTTLNARV